MIRHRTCAAVLALATLALCVVPALTADRPRPKLASQYDIVIYGGNSGGIAAAVQASRLGKSVLIIEPGRHIGGLTAGGLGATDIGNKAAIGGISREFYRAVAEHYADGERDMLDGLTIGYSDWWFNLRPSNTQPLLRLNIETDQADALVEHTRELGQLVAGA